jgi:eukaryotic-like serine/threonine-protein kinase
MSLPDCDVVLAGRYHMSGRIASGGMGEVWRAADTVLQRPVAVKLLRPEYSGDPDTLARFRAEARHAAAVSHPGIAHVYDYGEGGPDGSPFLVMELVDGPSLTELLARGPLDAVQTLDVVAQAAAALAAAHAAGLVHRDVKPGNLLVTPGGTVKITDFGIAYAAGSAPLTRTGALVGTPAYLAPERVAGAPATPASDLYSLGIVAYECLAGTPPFTGTPMQIALAHQRKPVPPLRGGVPGPVATFVAELTAREPAGRPRSAADVAARARYLQTHPAGAESKTRGWPASPARSLAAAALGARAAQAAPVASAPAEPAGASEPTLADAPTATPDAAAAGHHGPPQPPAAGQWPAAGHHGPPQPPAAGQWPAAGHHGPPQPASGPPGGPRRTMILQPPFQHQPPVGTRRTSALRHPLLRAVLVVAVIAGAAGWLLAAGVLARPASPPQRPPASSPASPSASPSTVDVNRSALVGMPVQAAEQQLTRLGLSVSVRWVPTRRASPGTVLGVQPSGQLQPGTPVVLEAAATPSGHHHHGNGQDGGDTGDGGGQGGG